MDLDFVPPEFELNLLGKIFEAAFEDMEIELDVEE